MRGLLLKDLYMIRAYCKSYMLVAAIFLFASVFGDNTFFIYYPCLLCGMIPVNLLAYDEKSRFIQYSISLPVSNAQTVSEKYIIGLFSQIAVLLLTGVVQAIKMSVNGTFVIGEFVIIMVSLLLVSMLASSIPLPLIFKNGVEKGRIAYYIMIGIVCGAGFMFSQIFKNNLLTKIPSVIIFAAGVVLVIGVYILSWYLSIVFYKRREF